MPTDLIDMESNPPHNKFDRTSSRSVILIGEIHHGPLPTVNVMRNEVVILQEYASPAVHEWISSSECLFAPPLRLGPDAGLDEGTLSLELGQPGQATNDHDQNSTRPRAQCQRQRANMGAVRLEIRAKKGGKGS